MSGSPEQGGHPAVAVDKRALNTLLPHLRGHVFQYTISLDSPFVQAIELLEDALGEPEDWWKER